MRLPALTELTPRKQEVSDAIAAKRGATRGGATPTRSSRRRGSAGFRR